MPERQNPWKKKAAMRGASVRTTTTAIRRLAHKACSHAPTDLALGPWAWGSGGGV